MGGKKDIFEDCEWEVRKTSLRTATV